MENWVIFLISGQGLDPDFISNQLQLKPDKIIADENTGIVTWQINSHLEGERKLEEHIEDILKKLYPVRRQIQGFSRKYHTTLNCSFRMDNHHFSVQIPPRYLSLIGYLGIHLEIFLFIH